MAIDIPKLSTTIMEKVGGVENVSSVTHCVTRLRFILKDKDKADTDGIKALRGVLGVVYGAGQYQIILGDNLFPVFDLITSKYDVKVDDEVDEDLSADDLSDTPAKRSVKHYLNKVAQFLSSTLTPFITVVYGAGMLKVVLSLVLLAVPSANNSPTYQMFNFMSDTAFYFMPILVAYGTARTLKSNPAFAIAMACMLLYPNFVALVGTNTPMDIFGIPVTVVKYSSTLLPAIFATLLVAWLEKLFYKIIPSVLKSVFAPLCTLAVGMPIVMCLLAPLGTILGGFVVSAFVGLYEATGGLAVGLLAAVWPFVVMAGMNMLFVAPMNEYLANNGFDNFFRPAWILHNMSEGGSCVGVALRTKNKELRSDALSAAIGAIVSGVSEPAIYGINLRLKRPFIGVAAGGLAGGCVAGFMGAKAYSLGYSSILAVPIFVDTAFAIAVAIAVSFTVSFAVSFALGFEDIPAEKSSE